jgi:hypothetical protein
MIPFFFIFFPYGCDWQIAPYFSPSSNFYFSSQTRVAVLEIAVLPGATPGSDVSA